MPHFHPPCWILSNPRTGSNYLCNALNQTGVYTPRFEEWLNPVVGLEDHLHTRWQPWKQIKLDEVVYRTNVELLIATAPRYLKIHSFDYKRFFAWSHKHAIIKRFPAIKFIRLRRRDLLATTVSYYLALKTGIFSTSPKNVEEHAAKQVPVNVDELLKYHEWVCGWDRAWDNFVSDVEHLEIWYEDLVSDSHVVARVYEYVGLPPQRANVFVPRDVKARHPQTPELVNLLKEILCQPS